MTDNTEPTPPVDFDLEAWVNGAVAARDSIDVSSRAGLAAQLADLATRLKRAEEKKGRAAAKRAEVEAIEDEMAQVAQALEDSWVEVEFRTPTPSERRKAFAGTDDDDTEQRVANLLATVGTIRPKGVEEWQTLDAAGWLRIFDTIGTAQYDALMLKFNGVAFTKGVTPGFSQRVLSSLETRRSGRS